MASLLKYMNIQYTILEAHMLKLQMVGQDLKVCWDLMEQPCLANTIIMWVSIWGGKTFIC